MKPIKAWKRSLFAGLVLISQSAALHAAESLDASLEALTGRVLDEQIGQQAAPQDAGLSIPVIVAAERARIAFGTSANQAAHQQDYIAALLACGLRERARALLASYPSDTQDPAVARLRYALAEGYLGLGQTEAAEILLPHGPSSDPGLHLRWTLFAGRLRLQQQRPREAAELMSAYLLHDPVALLSIDEPDALLLNILRYNLALSLIRTGDLDQGRSLLDWLGSRTWRSPELVALRDRANLSLGDLLLDETQGATAREAYLRIGSDGAAAGRAMLGLGWASIAEAGKGHARLDLEGGDRVLRASPDFVLKALRRRELIGCRTYNRQPHAAGELCGGAEPMASSDAGPDEIWRLRLAVQAWRWAIDRAPDSPVAREAALASASALAKLGESGAAVAILQTLADQLAADRDRLRATIDSLDGNRLPPPDGKFASEGLADALTPGQRIRLFADAEFMHTWTASSEARSLAGIALDQSLAAELVQLSDRFLDQATRGAIEHLQAEDQLYLQYQQAARQGLSRLLDPS